MLRIEISSGGLGLPVLDFQSDLAAFISDAEGIISSFQTVQNSTYALNGGVGDLEAPLEQIGSRLRCEEARKQEAERVQSRADDFVRLAERIDSRVASDVKRNKAALYGVNPWLRPTPSVTEEKPWYDRALSFLFGAGEAVVDDLKSAWAWTKDTAKKAWNGAVAFYSEHKNLCKILIGAAAIAVAVVVTAATGGAALPALLAMTKTALTAGLISAAIGGTVSAGLAIASGKSVEDTLNDTVQAAVDGLCSGFMWGGIFAAGGQMISCFRSVGTTANAAASRLPGEGSSSLSSGSDSSIPGTRTPQQSENVVSEFLGEDFQSQVSVNRDLSAGRYGAEGTIRLDSAHGEISGVPQNLNSMSDYSEITRWDVGEVKNYSIETVSGRSNLKNNILFQANQRNEILGRSGAEVVQTYYVDTVGHDVTIGEWERLYGRLEKLLPDNVDIFPMWK